MTLFSKWFAAALIFTSLIFLAPPAEAKKKTKAHATHTQKKSSIKKKKRTAKAEPKSPGYARAAEYMNVPREPSNTKKKLKKNKKSGKKKARKSRA